MFDNIPIESSQSKSQKGIYIPKILFLFLFFTPQKGNLLKECHGNLKGFIQL